jgi:hypothetical protein
MTVFFSVRRLDLHCLRQILEANSDTSDLTSYDM